MKPSSTQNKRVIIENIFSEVIIISTNPFLAQNVSSALVIGWKQGQNFNWNEMTKVENYCDSHLFRASFMDYDCAT